MELFTYYIEHVKTQFLSGLVSGRELAVLYSECDVFVQPDAGFPFNRFVSDHLS